MIKSIKAQYINPNDRLLTLSGIVTVQNITAKNGLFCVNEGIVFEGSERVLKIFKEDFM